MAKANIKKYGGTAKAAAANKAAMRLKIKKKYQASKKKKSKTLLESLDQSDEIYVLKNLLDGRKKYY